MFFLLAAAWVDPGRSALQSAEQWCKGRYGRIHNAEVNAGFAVLRGSNHAPPLLEEDWQSIPLGSGDSQDLGIRKYKEKLVSDYWKLVSTMVSHGRDDRDMTPSECQAWIQTGLALTPFAVDAVLLATNLQFEERDWHTVAV